jgi:hypothetical protein
MPSIGNAELTEPTPRAPRPRRSPHRLSTTPDRSADQTPVTISAIRGAASHLSGQRPLTDQLATAYEGLEVVENALRALTNLGAPDRSPHLARARSHAGTARASLARAPSLFWLSGSRPTGPAEAEDDTVLVAVLELADALVLSLVEAADQAHDPRDEAACIQASVQTCLLTKTLGRALEATRNAV